MYRNYQPYPTPYQNFNIPDQNVPLGPNGLEEPSHYYNQPQSNVDGGRNWEGDSGNVGNLDDPNGSYSFYNQGPQRQGQYFESRQPNQRGFRGGRGRGGRGGGRCRQNYGQPHNHGGSPNQPFQHKPWMTDDLLKLIKERDDLHQKAMESRNPDDWSVFKAVRKRATLTLNDAKRIYEINNPPKASEAVNEKSKFNCDTCDRGFPTEEIWRQHNAEHVTCKLDGCQFTAHPKVILKHIEIQHSNNLYIRIKGFETPEEIGKWIELRKSKYPTVQNVERKKEERAERFKRGERIPVHDGKNDKSFNRGNRNWQGKQESKFQRDRRPDRRHSNGDSKDIIQNCKENSSPPPPSGLHSSHTSSETTEQLQTPVISDKPLVLQAQEESKPRHAPRPQFSFGDENIPKVTPELTRCCKNVIVLENFYSQIRISDNGNLTGKKLMLWNGETQKLCQKIARTGLPMKNVQGDASIESEDSDDDDSVADVITDEEDADPALVELPVSTPIVNTVTPLKTGNVELESNVKTATASVVSNSSLCLVNYSSDSDSDNEAPDEKPAVVVKEEVIEIKSETEIPLVQSKTEDVNLNSKSADELILKQKGSKMLQNKSRNQDAVKNVAGRGRIIKRRRQPRMPRLLKKLLEDDIRRERNQILQVCRYIVEKNFFDAVVPSPVDPQECVHSSPESETNLGLQTDENNKVEDISYVKEENSVAHNEITQITPPSNANSIEDKEDGQVD